MLERHCSGPTSGLTRNGCVLENAMQASRAQSLQAAMPTASAATLLLRRYQEIRRTTIDLSRPFSAEDQVLQSMPDASPMKWHIAHTTWFFETFILAAHADGYRSLDPRYRHLFNSYY